MAILLRRGPSADFDADRMSSGEIGVATDIHRAWVTTSPGDAWEIANKEDLDATQDALDAEVTAREELETAIEEEIVPEIEKKANADGTYPDLYAGNLSSTRKQTDSVPYLMRKTGGNLSRIGEREDDTLVGATVNANQQAYKTRANNTDSGVTLTANGDGTYTFNGTASGNPTWVISNSTNNNHVYYHALKSTGANVKLFRAGYVATRLNNSAQITKLSTANPFMLTVLNGDSANDETATPQIIDLTDYFSSASIADYIYSLESATAGAGVAKLKEWGFFTEEYYEYNAGSLESVEPRSHVMRGFNQFDASTITDNAYVSGSNGALVTSQPEFFCSDYIRVLPNTAYYSNTDVNGRIYTHIFFDSDKNFIGNNSTSKGVFTTPQGAFYMRVNAIKSKVSASDICINLSSDRNGEYEPYVSHTYDLGTDTLRGLFKLDSNNNLYADGDTKTSDGTVTRRYGVVDLGTLDWTAYASSATTFTLFFAQISGLVSRNGANGVCTKYSLLIGGYDWQSLNDKQAVLYVGAGEVRIGVRDSAYTDTATFKAAMSGVMLVYELATPTTETADPFTNPQICDPDGTEEYVTSNGIPVGHNTEYDYDIKGLAEELIDVPDVPSADGTYVLKATRSASGISYEWVEETSTASTPATTTAEAEAGDTV